MNDIDTPVPPAAGGVLGRMIVLARLCERIGRLEPRRVLLDKILQRMLLFSRMSERLGIAAPESPLMRAVLREAELGCLECTAWRRCRRWLDGRSPDDDYRDFCPNEGFFAVLPRVDNVKRPHSPE
ncbi:MAG TPA: DUF6455 family protein [Stellaceae bacterium]